MASISTIKSALNVCRKANITPFIWGVHGIGKSSAVNQFAKQNRMGFVDCRCSQMEGVDIRGLVVEDNGRTSYLVPRELPVGDMTYHEVMLELAKVLDIENPSDDVETIEQQICDALKDADNKTIIKYNQRYYELQPRLENGILFLDELNRAQDDVLQAVFQLVLDRAVGSYVLPPGWSVVVAGNYMEGYVVNGFDDPAFLDRFCHIKLSPGEATANEWASWMVNEYGDDAEKVIQFALQNMKHLDGEPKGELGFQITPSRRSWSAVTRVLAACRELQVDEIVKLEVISGLIGTDLAISFCNFDCPIQPLEVLNAGIKKYRKRIIELTRNQLIGLMWGVASFAKDKVNTDDKIATNCLDLAEFLLKNQPDKDLVVAFCRSLVNENVHEDLRSAVIANPALARLGAKYGKTGGFLAKLNSRPELQELLSNVIMK